MGSFVILAHVALTQATQRLPSLILAACVVFRNTTARVAATACDNAAAHRAAAAAAPH
eukprot:gene35593-20960_t